jgi:hypothetical protein
LREAFGVSGPAGRSAGGGGRPGGGRRPRRRRSDRPRMIRGSEGQGGLPAVSADRPGRRSQRRDAMWPGRHGSGNGGGPHRALRWSDRAVWVRRPIAGAVLGGVESTTHSDVHARRGHGLAGEYCSDLHGRKARDVEVTARSTPPRTQKARTRRAGPARTSPGASWCFSVLQLGFEPRARGLRDLLRHRRARGCPREHPDRAACDARGTTAGVQPSEEAA